MKNKTTISMVAVILLVSLWFIVHRFINTTPPPSTTNVPNQSPVEQIPENPKIGERTKTEHCVAQNSLPDKDCTPGGIIQGVTKEQICKAGYASATRDVSEKDKAGVYKEYDIISHKTGEYEVDHLVSLELGGSNDASNLWPEPAQPIPGFHEKDKVENYLHKQVCNGEISLEDAQIEIANNWLDVYNQLQLVKGSN